MGILSEMRRPTIFGLTIFDTILSIIGLYLLILLVRVQMKLGISLLTTFVLAILVAIPLSIIAHKLLDIPTPLTCKLGLFSSTKCIGVREM